MHSAQRGQITDLRHATHKRSSWGLAAQADHDSIAHTSTAERYTWPSAKGTEETSGARALETVEKKGCLYRALRWATWGRIPAVPCISYKTLVQVVFT